MLDDRNIEPRTLDNPTSNTDTKNEFDRSIIAQRNQALMDLVNFIIEFGRTSSWSFYLSPFTPWSIYIILPEVLKFRKITDADDYVHMIGKRFIGPDRTHDIPDIRKETCFREVGDFLN